MDIQKSQNELEKRWDRLIFSIDKLCETGGVTQASLWQRLLCDIANCRNRLLEVKNQRFYFTWFVMLLELISTKYVPAWEDKIAEAFIHKKDYPDFSEYLDDFTRFLEKTVDVITQFYNGEPEEVAAFAKAFAEANFSLALLKQWIVNAHPKKK